MVETKEYKYAIIIAGLAYVLTDHPDIEFSNGRVHIKCGFEFEADLSATASWVIVPYEDWLSAHGPGSWAKELKG